LQKLIIHFVDVKIDPGLGYILLLGFSLLALCRPTMYTDYLGPAPTGTQTIALDPTFGSFTLLKLVSHFR